MIPVPMNTSAAGRKFIEMEEESGVAKTHAYDGMAPTGRWPANKFATSTEVTMSELITLARRLCHAR